ncbi:MAG: 50S ribosomal protein L23 [Acidobacteriota bacterium]
MREDHQIILKPLITEKSTILKEERGQYCFEVARYANKNDVKRAVEQLFNVKVESVRISNVVGKVKRMGRSIGRRRDWKKAYVKLKAGEKTIEFFEGT